MELRKSFSQGKELVSIDPAITGHVGLLKRAYDEVYCPAFPIEDERAPLELWLNRFANQDTSPVKYSILIAGEKLLAAQSKVESIAVAIYYADAQAGFMPYIAVADDARGQGYMRTMTDFLIGSLKGLAENEKQEISAMFFEVNDPAKITEEESGFDPALLIAMYKKLGAHEVPLNPYVQPAQGEDLPRFDKLKLFYFLTRDNHPDANEVLALIRAVYKGAGIVPELNQDFIGMERQLKTAAPRHDFT